MLSPCSDNRQLIFVLQGFTFNSFAYFDAPSSFLGNKRFSYGQTLSFNLRLALLNSRVTLMSMVDGDVVIKGFSLRTSISAALPHLPSGNFQKFTVRLVRICSCSFIVVFVALDPTGGVKLSLGKSEWSTSDSQGDV